MSQSISIGEFQDDHPVIDLTDISIVLQFAECVKNLSTAHRQSIWSQNVNFNRSMQSQTMSQSQINDILLFLIIIYGKEQYPDEEEQLIAKLKLFIASSPFIAMTKYIQKTYFPLYCDEFVHNNNYFSSMIEDYGTTISKYGNSSMRSLRCMRCASECTETETESSGFSALAATDLNDLYSKLEEKVMQTFASKLNELENKINNISKDVECIKYAMIQETKQLNVDDNDINGIMQQIKVIKKEINKINKKQETKQPNAQKPIPNKKLKTNKKKKKKAAIKQKRKNTKHTIAMQEIEKKREEFKKWMKSIELIEYFDIFIENGLNNLSIIQQVSITDLALLGINNLAHKVKIMQNIQKLKYEQQQKQKR